MSLVKCDIAVCGRFHVSKYAKFLAQRDVLRNIYYSYKVGSTFGLHSKHRKNFWLKEYITHAFLRQRFIRSQSALGAAALYWDWRVSRDVTSGCDVLHVLIQGEVRRTIRAYKQAGAVVLGEAINTHPRIQQQLLSSEDTDDESSRRTSLIESKCEAINDCDFLLAPSLFVKNSFVEAGFDPRKIFTVPYAMDISPPQDAITKTPENNISVLCVGYIGSRKGQRYLIDAVRSVRSLGLNVRLTLCGRGSKNLLQEISEIEFCDHVTHVPNSGMIRFMRQFDLFVLPSIEDGFGIVVAEALSAGLPVLVSRNAGAADLVAEGTNGFTFEAGRAEAIEQALLNSIGKEFDLSNTRSHTWSDYADELIQIYNKIRTAS